MPGLVTIPTLPENRVYPGVHPDYYPPEQILEAFRAVHHEENGIWLKWTTTREPSRPIRAFHILSYEYTEYSCHPYIWRSLRMECVQTLPSRMFFPSSCFNRRRRYYFTIRLMDDLNLWGPYSQPAGIDI